MTTGQPTLHCPCGERDVETVYTYRQPPAGEILFGLSGDYHREYRQCRLCGHFFSWYGMAVTNPYGGAYIDATYGDADRVRQAYDRIMGLPAERSDNQARAARVDAFAALRAVFRPTRSLLDVGAGLGVFPAAMQRRGWTVTALDPDPRNERHYREVVGVTPLIGDFLVIDPDRLGRYDAVTFNKVLEHVADPTAMLRQARLVVADGGFLYVELPDTAAAAEGPEREEFGFGHHHVFSPASTALLLERCGFQVRRIDRIREPSTKYTLYAFATPT